MSTEATRTHMHARMYVRTHAQHAHTHTQAYAHTRTQDFTLRVHVHCVQLFVQDLSHCLATLSPGNAVILCLKTVTK